MDGAESSSESEMEVDDKSEEEMDRKVNELVRLWWERKGLFLNLPVVLMLFSHGCLQPPQKKERKMTPTIKEELMNEDEFAGSTDLDEPG